MTPFAQLEKVATTQPRAAYRNPFTYVESAATKAPGMSLAEKGDLAMMGASLIPVVGGAVNGLWQVGRGIYNASQGNWGSAAGNLGYAAAGLIPGLGLGAKGVGMAGKLMAGANAANTATRLGRATAAVGGAAQRAGNAINTVGAKGLIHAGGTRVGSAKPWAGFTTPNVTAGKLGLGTTGLVAPAAVEAALPNYGEQQPKVAPAPQPLDPNQSDSHYLASIMSGGA